MLFNDLIRSNNKNGSSGQLIRIVAAATASAQVVLCPAAAAASAAKQINENEHSRFFSRTYATGCYFFAVKL